MMMITLVHEIPYMEFDPPLPHSYGKIGDYNSIRVRGLEGRVYHIPLEDNGLCMSQNKILDVFQTKKHGIYILPINVLIPVNSFISKNEFEKYAEEQKS